MARVALFEALPACDNHPPDVAPSGSHDGANATSAKLTVGCLEVARIRAPRSHGGHYAPRERFRAVRAAALAHIIHECTGRVQLALLMGGFGDREAHEGSPVAETA